jgi:hypothetical protein
MPNTKTLTISEIKKELNNLEIPIPNNSANKIAFYRGICATKKIANSLYRVRMKQWGKQIVGKKRKMKDEKEYNDDSDYWFDTKQVEVFNFAVSQAEEVYKKAIQ